MIKVSLKAEYFYISNEEEINKEAERKLIKVSNIFGFLSFDKDFEMKTLKDIADYKFNLELIEEGINPDSIEVEEIIYSDLIYENYEKN